MLVTGTSQAANEAQAEKNRQSLDRVIRQSRMVTGYNEANRQRHVPTEMTNADSVQPPHYMTAIASNGPASSDQGTEEMRPFS